MSNDLVTMEWEPHKEGVFLHLDAETYHSAPGVSNSMLGEMMDSSPAHLQGYLRTKREASAALKFGWIFHQMVLEPRAPVWWVAAPQGLDFKTKAGKEWKAEQEGKGLEVIRHHEGKALEGMVDALRRHELAQLALWNGEGENEVSVFKRFDYGGETLRKCRMDRVTPKVIVDLKSLDSAHPAHFAKSCLHELHGGYGYARQSAYYLDAWNDARPDARKDVFVFVCVEKEARAWDAVQGKLVHAVAIYQMDRQFVGYGRGNYTDLLRDYIACEKSGRWPSYPVDVTNLSAPAWAVRHGLAQVEGIL